MMGLHKLTAGDGYTYLTRQVAALDSTEKGHASLGDYYAQKGEAPGRWLGSGLAALGIGSGEQVTAAQMKALFGEGRHPNADTIEAAVVAAGGTRRPRSRRARWAAHFRSTTNRTRGGCGWPPATRRTTAATGCPETGRCRRR
jgi:hypothetical protein